MTPEIVLVGPLYPPTQARLERLFQVHPLWLAADRDAFLRGVAERVRGIAVYALHGCPAALIDALPRVEIVACLGIGVDAIAVAHARSRGIAVTNTPDVVTEDTADTAMALMLAVERRIAEGDRFLRRGDWRRGELRFGRAMRGRRVGILGLGRIGRAIAERCAAFGTTIAYHGPREKREMAYRFFADLGELARWSDILVIAATGGEKTRHLVEPRGPRCARAGRHPDQHRPRLDRRRGGAGQGAAAGAIGGAGLDVFEHEPEVPAALTALDNVVLMPHTGSATHETRGAMGELFIDNLVAHFAGRPLPTPVG